MSEKIIHLFFTFYYYCANFVTNVTESVRIHIPKKCSYRLIDPTTDKRLVHREIDLLYNKINFLLSVIY